MFTEILRVKPVLDQASTKKMEMNLSQRFGRVAGRFGKGMEKIMKGNLLFLSAGFLASLMNPLKKVEDKMRELLNQGVDLQEVADQFETSAGKLSVLQQVSRNTGLGTENLSSLMNSFKSALETARIEISGKGDLSEQTKQLQYLELVDGKDMAESFNKFIQYIGKMDRDSSTRQQLERSFFGGIQRGASRRFIEADFGREFSRTSGSTRINSTTGNLTNMAERERRQATRRETEAYINQGGMVNRDFIDYLNASAQKDIDRDSKDMANMKSLQAMKTALDEVVDLLKDIQRGVGELIALAVKVWNYLPTTRALKYLFRSEN